MVPGGCDRVAQPATPLAVQHVLRRAPRLVSQSSTLGERPRRQNGLPALTEQSVPYERIADSGVSSRCVPGLQELALLQSRHIAGVTPALPMTE